MKKGLIIAVLCIIVFSGFPVFAGKQTDPINIIMAIETADNTAIFDDIAFWNGIIEKINNAKAGDIIRVSVKYSQNVPVRVLQEMSGADVTLALTKEKFEIEIYGRNMLPIKENRIFYTFETLDKLYGKKDAL